MNKLIYITDANFIYCGQRAADLDPMASKREGKDVYTGPFPYASFDKPPEYEQDEYAILVNEKWEIRKRQAGVYWHKKTLERLEVIDPYSGDLGGYTAVEPPAHHPEDSLTFKKGQWAVTMCDVSIAAFKEHLVKQANAQCQGAIVAKYPPYKQINALMAAEDQDLRTMTNFISEQRAACKALKARINSASQRQLHTIESELNGQ
jgi:hypothetical protein